MKLLIIFLIGIPVAVFGSLGWAYFSGEMRHNDEEQPSQPLGHIQVSNTPSEEQDLTLELASISPDVFTIQIDMSKVKEDTVVIEIKK